jgi:protein-disulfide isomerase
MTTLRPSVTDRDHQAGNYNSTLTLVEYGDYQCAHCRRAYSFVERLLKEHGSEIKFVFRHFPLTDMHPKAITAAQSAEAAGAQGNFWEMHRLLFENQNRFDERTVFLHLADKLGLQISQFFVDLKNNETISKVEKDFKGGVYSGVRETPTFFINESKVYTYDGSYPSLLSAVEPFIANLLPIAD